MKFNGALYDRMYRGKPYQEEVERILPYLSGKTILDVGGGTGNHAVILRGKGYQPEVLDLSESMLKSAAQKGLPVVHGDIQSFSPLKRYDSAIALFHVLNFCKDLQHALTHIASALNTKGVLIFDVWDPTIKKEGTAWLSDGIMSRVSFKKWIGNEVYITFFFPFLLRLERNHLYCPSTEEITTSLQQSGFVVEKCQKDGVSNFIVARKA